jgi:2',3'-cyclic-nucleotide 2'-phosphodiesterase (5'-nucleotidase family)/SAM-dependent methyltransferase
MAARLAETRDRVLNGAAFEPGDVVLDVGAGHGLIAFGALERGAGEVVFSDISVDLLEHARDLAEELGVAARCRFVHAAAENLEPIEGASVDVVTTRSVLIYVRRKADAFREFLRVLRPGGRVSIFEPINRFGCDFRSSESFWGYPVDGVADVRDKVTDLYRRLQPDDDPMLDFDDRDLVTLAVEAGFFPVQLELDVEVTSLEPMPWERFANTPGNPKIRLSPRRWIGPSPTPNAIGSQRTCVRSSSAARALAGGRRPTCAGRSRGSNVRRLIVLHSNDIHGRVDALARIATLVESTRAEAGGAAVLYVDAGDVEDTTERLSNLTKGVALHRLLRVAGCQAVAVGNGTVIRYGVDPLVEQARVAGYPHLAANLQRDGQVVPGAQARALLDVDGICVGLVGLTPTEWRDLYTDALGVELPDELRLVREHSDALWAGGADAVILLSHVGIERDRDLAAELEGEITLIVGSHSHTLLEAGERVRSVTIVQAGQFGTHFGHVELELDGGVARVVSARAEPVPPETPAHPGVAAELERIERELAAWLAEPVGELTGQLELAFDRECPAVTFVADVVRERMGAEIGVVTAGVALVSSLPGGRLTRGRLYEACPSPGVSCVATLTGTQLVELLRRGLDAERAAETIRSLRGVPRGFAHLSGAEVREGWLWIGGERVDLERGYRVAATDWELGTYGGYADPEWDLEVVYDGTTIVREAIEDHFRHHPRVEPPGPRIHGLLNEAGTPRRAGRPGRA